MEKQRLVLSSGGNYPAMLEILEASFPERPKLYLRRRLNKEVSELIDALYIYSESERKARTWLIKTDMNLWLPPYPYHALSVDSEGNVDAECKLHDKRNFREIARAFSKTIQEQIEEYGLRTLKGYLPYSLVPVKTENFNDIVLEKWTARINKHQNWSYTIDEQPK